MATTKHNYTYSLNAASAPKYPAPGQQLFLLEQEQRVSSSVSASKWQPPCTGTLTCSFVSKSYFYWIHEASAPAWHFVLVLGLQRKDTIICTSQPGSADVIVRANKPRGSSLAPAVLSGEVAAAGAGAFKAASQVLKYSAKLPETSRIYF